MTATELWGRARTDARAWCAGRSWAWRAPLLAYLAWAGLQHLRDETYSSIFGAITFGIHELGHVVMAWAGHFLMIAGGSLFQVLAPVAAAALLLRQRDWFGVSVAGAWLSFSLFNLATYIGDARAQELPLLGLSDDPEHDWHAMLSTLGLLEQDTLLAGLVRVAAFGVWAASVAFGAWILWQMHAQRGAGSGVPSVHRPLPTSAIRAAPLPRPGPPPRAP